MSYQPKYANETDIERELQFEITESTKPSSTQVNQFIKNTEAEMDKRLLGWGDGRAEGEGYLAENIYLDVTLQPSHMMIARNLEALMYRKLILTTVDIQFGRYFPGIKVVSLSRRLGGITDAPSWEALTEGYYTGWNEAAGADFLCDRQLGRAGQQHLMKIGVFGGKRPEAGLGRVKATIWYGWNLPLEILKRWCICKVAVKVLNALAMSGEPTRLGSFVKGDFQEYTNNQYDVQMAEFDSEAIRIERKYFPKYPYEGVSILRI